MKLPVGAARAPLFVRVFVLMLVCVAVIQFMNLVLLIAAQAPSAKLYTVGQIADTMAQGHDPHEVFTVRKRESVHPAPWTPRAERIELAIATALGVAPSRVEINFPTPFLQPERQYDRASVPRPLPPVSREAARDVVVMGDFSAALRLADGSWIKVRSTNSFEPWRWFVLIWLVVSVIAVAPFAWMLARRFGRPIRAFAAAAERLGRDPKAAPLDIGGPGEIAEAAAAFNQMQTRLNRYVDDRTTVIAAIAHDLRTPLMRLSLRLENVPDSVRAACEADVGEMQAMISAAVSYVRDTSQLEARRALDLRSLAENVVDEASDRGKAATLLQGEPLVIEGHPVAIKTLLDNLIGNAIKYARGAEVSLYRRDGFAVIEVADRGPGMPPEDLERAFEPFFRGERSRNRKTGGFGLGLASARAVARAHGGDVTLENRPEGGLLARAVLPL